MKTRRVYSTPDIKSARAALSAARQAGIPDEDLSLVARHDIELDVIPEDRKEDHSDFMPAAVRGLAQGGATGTFHARRRCGGPAKERQFSRLRTASTCSRSSMGPKGLMM